MLERVLEFDLSGLPYSNINAEFLNGLGKVLRFEGQSEICGLASTHVWWRCRNGSGSRQSKG